VGGLAAHTYSRTRLLFHEFVTAFEQADHGCDEIYAARENRPEDGFSSSQIVAAMSFPEAQLISDFSQAATYLSEKLEPGDVLLVLSAGDADQISTRVLERLNERS
jgi:UDP-N-acetylmuramate--alanine ligase